MTEDKNNPRTERGARILEELKARTPSKETSPTEEDPQAETSSPSPSRDRRRRGSTREKSSSRRSGRRASKRGRRREKEEGEEASKSKGGLIAILAGVFIFGGGAVWWFGFRDSGEKEAEASEGKASHPSVGEETVPAVPLLEVKVPPPPPEIEEPADPDALEEIVEETSPSPPTPSVPPPSAGFTPPPPGEVIAYQGITELSVLNLASVPLLPKWEGSTNEEWADIQADVALFAADDGARSSRAGDRLVQTGRAAFPEIVNCMLQGEWDTKGAVRNQLSLNDLLTKMGKGTNLGWKSTELLAPESPEFREAALFDKKVAAQWHYFWVRKFSVDDAQWEGFASNENERKKKAAEKAGTAGPPKVASPATEDFDD